MSDGRITVGNVEISHVNDLIIDFPLTFVRQALTPLGALGALDLIDGERSLTSEVTAIHTPGHTPGSMSLLIVSGDERALLTGDSIVHPAQVENPDLAFASDHDGDTAQHADNWWTGSKRRG